MRLARERDEALLRETANSAILGLIAKSPGDLELVFRTILEHATRICEAKFGTLFRVDDGVVHTVAALGLTPALATFMQGAHRLGPHSATARAIRTREAIHIVDFRKEKGYREGDPMMVAGADLGGIRTLVAVPMLKDKIPIGVIGIYRTEMRPFTDKQIALVQNFAAQAVIAIENARLLSELRQSLEQQTATADVLRVISSSPGDLKPVFNAMLENAVRLCEAELGHLFLYDGEVFHAAALHSASQAFAEVRRRPVVLREIHPDNPLAVITRTKAVVHTADVRTEKSYIERDPSFSEFVDVSGARAVLLVPMLKENELIGAFTIYRLEVRRFTDKQIDLVKNFAAQAVIAIENARLLNELRQWTTDLTESLEQQTATAEVLRVISSSPGEPEPVFQTLLENATRLCEARFGVLGLCEGDAVRVRALHNQSGVTRAPPMSRSLLNIAKRSLLRLMLSCVGLASKHAAGGVSGLARFQGGT